MGKAYCCPICDADLILDGDEESGDSVYCSFCNSKIKLSMKKGSDEFTLSDDN